MGKGFRKVAIDSESDEEEDEEADKKDEKASSA